MVSTILGISGVKKTGSCPVYILSKLFKLDSLEYLPLSLGIRKMVYSNVFHPTILATVGLPMITIH